MNENPPDREQWLQEALDQFEGRLLRYARQMVGDADLAADCVQETFLRLIREDRERLEGHLGEWLFRVCRSRALDVLRKETRVAAKTVEMTEPEVAAGGGPDERLDREEGRLSVRDAIEGLGGREREIVRLKFEQGLSYREIASVTGESQASVGWLLNRALKELRGRLKAMDRMPLGAARRGT